MGIVFFLAANLCWDLHLSVHWCSPETADNLTEGNIIILQGGRGPIFHLNMGSSDTALGISHCH